VIHEGFRALNHGVKEIGGISCELLACAIQTYAADLVILGEFIQRGGVPLPGGGQCNFDASDELIVHGWAVEASVILQELCAFAAAQGCPVPPECQ
jgi:hypothetical protein